MPTNNKRLIKPLVEESFLALLLTEYILALKIAAGRKKDLDDCAILFPKTKIRTREQAQQVLDQYILPAGQQKNAESIENALNRLFGRKG